MVPATTKSAIIDMMEAYKRIGDHSVTCDLLSRVLRIRKASVLGALQELVAEGRVQHARKNPSSSSARYQLVAGARSK